MLDLQDYFIISFFNVLFYLPTLLGRFLQIYLLTLVFISSLPTSYFNFKELFYFVVSVSSCLSCWFPIIGIVFKLSSASCVDPVPSRVLSLLV